MTQQWNYARKLFMGWNVIVTYFCLIPTFSWGQFTGPYTINITGVNSVQFEVSFFSFPDAESYNLSIQAMHDPSDLTEIVVPSFAERSQTQQVTGRRSNINYLVTVRAFNDTDDELVSNMTTARTAPSGASILQYIANPTFITVFLEEVPGSTAWQIKYTNTDNNETKALNVPTGTPSNTSYVAIIDSLTPNTRYEMQARVSEINSATTYDETQSPYGNIAAVTTERLSAFGRVHLLRRSFDSSDNNNEILKQTIAEELFAAYSDDSIFNVLVVELAEESGLVLCHHEILLNNKTALSNSPDLTLTDGTSYGNLEVVYNVSETKSFRGYTFNGNTLRHVESSHCHAENLQKDIRTWTLFNKNGEVATSTLNETANPKDETRLLFDDTAIAYSTGEEIFSLLANFIYGIKQSYLLKTCVSSRGNTTIYDRYYGAFGIATSDQSDKYTIFYTTKPQIIDISSIDYVTTTNDASVFLEIPRDALPRSTRITLNVNGNMVTLNEADLDSSLSYKVDITGLADSSLANVNITGQIRTHKELTSFDEASVDINECTSQSVNCSRAAECNNTLGSFLCTCNVGFEEKENICIDIEECSRKMHDCDENANCTNTIGSYNCTCNDGYSGNGTTCEDIEECILNKDDCDENANCTNTIGSYNCTCNDGYSGNGTNCEDIEECSLNMNDCDYNADCTNTIGMFSCTCKGGFTGDGRNCNDINECNMISNICHENGFCANTIGSFFCFCQFGYRATGTDCEDIDECISDVNSCSDRASCNNTPGSFRCICKNGFTGTGINCADFDECYLNTNICADYAYCENTVGDYTCTCNHGFIGNGTFCEDFDECTLNMDDCDENANCANTVGSYDCTCNEGFFGNGSECVDIEIPMISVDQTGTSSFLLTLNSFEQSLAYEVFIQNVASGTTFSIPIISNPTTVNGLTPGTQYSVQVYIENPRIQSNNERIITVSASPSSFSIDEIGVTFARFSWSNVKGATSYELKVTMLTQADSAREKREKSSPVTLTKIINATSVNYSEYIRGLEPGSSYVASLSAINEAGKSDEVSISFETTVVPTIESPGTSATTREDSTFVPSVTKASTGEGKVLPTVKRAGVSLSTAEPSVTNATSEKGLAYSTTETSGSSDTPGEDTSTFTTGHVSVTSTSGSVSLPPAWIAAPIIAGLILLAVFGILIYRCRNNTKSRKTYQV